MSVAPVFIWLLHTGAAQRPSTMAPDVARLVRAAGTLADTWPSQPPPAIPEVAIVARHGRAVVPLLTGRDGRWTLQRQVASDRYYAAHLLGDLRDPRGVDLLVPLLEDEEVDSVVPWSLAEIGDRGAIGPLILQLERDEPSARVRAIYALETLKAGEALPKLRELLADGRRSTFAGLTTVAEAARRAIAVIPKLP